MLWHCAICFICIHWSSRRVYCISFAFSRVSELEQMLERVEDSSKLQTESASIKILDREREVADLLKENEKLRVRSGSPGIKLVIVSWMVFLLDHILISHYDESRWHFHMVDIINCYSQLSIIYLTYISSNRKCCCHVQI